MKKIIEYQKKTKNKKYEAIKIHATWFLTKIRKIYMIVL